MLRRAKRVDTYFDQNIFFSSDGSRKLLKAYCQSYAHCCLSSIYPLFKISVKLLVFDLNISYPNTFMEPLSFLLSLGLCFLTMLAQLVLHTLYKYASNFSTNSNGENEALSVSRFWYIIMFTMFDVKITSLFFCPPSIVTCLSSLVNLEPKFCLH